MSIWSPVRFLSRGKAGTTSGVVDETDGIGIGTNRNITMNNNEYDVQVVIDPSIGMGLSIDRTKDGNVIGKYVMAIVHR